MSFLSDMIQLMSLISPQLASPSSKGEPQTNVIIAVLELCSFIFLHRHNISLIFLRLNTEI